MLKAVIAFHRLGPYHRARVRSLGGAIDTVVLEVCGSDDIYGWPACAPASDLRWCRLFDDDVEAQRSFGRLRDALWRVLKEQRPDVVFVPGWGEPWALLILAWCARESVPAVLMSESNENDASRSWLGERMKALVCGRVDAALVGGSRAKAYLERLGLSKHRVWTGYDVVDNGHFETNGRDWTGGVLASARFIRRKNLEGLVEAFASHRRRRPQSEWTLTILGDGPEREKVEAAMRARNLGEYARVEGWVAYSDLPGKYRDASLFVHPAFTEQWGLVVNEAIAAGLPVLVSNACGCAPELVREGVNGYTFDPTRPEELGGLLDRMWDERQGFPAMGRASRDIARQWGAEAFRDGALAAAQQAVAETGLRRDPFWSEALEAMAYARSMVSDR